MELGQVTESDACWTVINYHHTAIAVLHILLVLRLQASVTRSATETRPSDTSCPFMEGREHMERMRDRQNELSPPTARLQFSVSSVLQRTLAGLSYPHYYQGWSIATRLRMHSVVPSLERPGFLALRKRPQLRRYELRLCPLVMSEFGSRTKFSGCDLYIHQITPFFLRGKTVKFVEAGPPCPHIHTQPREW